MIQVTQGAEMKELEVEDLEELLGEIYDEIEFSFIQKNIKYTTADVCEKACKLLKETLYKMDPNSDWEVSIIYDSMQDLYDKHTTDT